MPVAILSENFLAQLLALQDYGVNNGAASRNVGQRQWMVPDFAAGGDAAIPGLAEAYNREELEDLYELALTDSDGSAGDAMALKLQSDYLAGQERAYRLRSCSPVRATLHAAARRSAHGIAGTGVLGRVASHIQDLIVAGSAGFRPNGE